MADQGGYNDEYVAEVLKSDARESSIKYSTLGTKAFMPQRPSGAAPKPNTRFLSQIIQNANTHNAALLAKERRDARQRQRRLEMEGGYRRSSHHDKFGMNHDSPERSSKRRRVDSDESRDSRRSHRRDREHQRNRSRSPIRSDDHNRHRYRSRSRSRDTKRTHHSSDEADERRSHRRRHGEHDRNRVSSREHHHNSSRRHSDRSRKTHRNNREEQPLRHLSPASLDKSNRSAATTQAQSSASNFSKHSKKNPSHDSDSDPLEALFGPAPPPTVKARGRGALTAAGTTMDARFNADYDPNNDVHPGSDDDDWDMALEAMRDRQKWKQQGAERLRVAGFTDAQVKTWSKGGEKDETDVRWAKQGEGREWDRGKVVDSDKGEVELKPEWGRLKGT